MPTTSEILCFRLPKGSSRLILIIFRKTPRNISAMFPPWAILEIGNLQFLPPGLSLVWIEKNWTSPCKNAAIKALKNYINSKKKQGQGNRNMKKKLRCKNKKMNFFKFKYKSLRRGNNNKDKCTKKCLVRWNVEILHLDPKRNLILRKWVLAKKLSRFRNNFKTKCRPE